MSDPYHARVLDRIWRGLESAVTTPQHPWRTAVVATAGPSARILVLREVDAPAHRLAFYTDARSHKIEALRAEPRVEWVFWNPRIREQLRLRAVATLHHQDEVSAAAWAALPPQAWREYSTVAPPGALTSTRAEATARVDETAAAASFAVVRCVVDQIDWMQLGPAAEHQRICFVPAAEGWQGAWRVP